MILDADVLIDLLRKRPEAALWLRSLEVPPNISGIAALEALYGAKNRTEQYDVEGYLNTLPILWPSEADAQLARQLAPYKLSDGIGFVDVLTAAIALRHDMPLITFNVKHFRCIPGLTTAQPYVRQ